MFFFIGLYVHTFGIQHWFDAVPWRTDLVYFQTQISIVDFRRGTLAVHSTHHTLFGRNRPYESFAPIGGPIGRHRFWSKQISPTIFFFKRVETRPVSTHSFVFFKIDPPFSFVFCEVIQVTAVRCRTTRMCRNTPLFLHVRGRTRKCPVSTHWNVKTARVSTSPEVVIHWRRYNTSGVVYEKRRYIHRGVEKGFY